MALPRMNTMRTAANQQQQKFNTATLENQKLIALQSIAAALNMHNVIAQNTLACLQRIEQVMRSRR